MDRKDPNIVISSRLLLTAAVLDGYIVVLLARIVSPGLARSALMRSIPVDIPPFLISLILCLAGFWVVTEVIAAGRTPGRLCLGLSPSMSHGGNARVKALLWRFLYKFLTLGLGGLRIDHVSAYDRSAGIVWKADISHSAEPRRRHRQGRSPVLRIEDNAGGGRQVRLNNLPGFNRTGIVSIGRDPVWANVILNSNRVSRKHCILRIRGNRAELKDQAQMERAQPGAHCSMASASGPVSGLISAMLITSMSPM